MSESKSLKNCSIAELEEAIATAISTLTGTDAKAEIGSFLVVNDAIAEMNCQEAFKLDLSLKVGKSYTIDKDPL